MTTADDNREYRELLREWEDEKVFWLAWFSDVSNTSTVTALPALPFLSSRRALLQAGLCTHHPFDLRGTPEMF